MRRILFNVAVASCLLLGPSRGAADAPSFRSDVFPIFRDNCLACHSAQTRMGGLLMEDYESLMRGGANGPAIQPGDAAGSRLVLMIEGKLEPKMPLQGELPPQNLAAIRAWIDAGAPGEEVEAAAPVIPDVKPKGERRSPVGSLAWSPDGTLLALGRIGETELANASTGKIVRRLEGHADLVRSLAFSPDGSLLAAAGGRPLEQGEVKIWRVSDGKLLQTLEGHADCIYAADFSPDGKTLATASYDRLAKLWNVADGAERATLKDHVDAVFALKFGPRTGQLATAGADRSVKLWNLETGRPAATISEPGAGVLTLAFHPSGDRIAGGGKDRTLRTWRLSGADGPELLRAMTGHEGDILQAVYAPGGESIVTSSADRSLKVWDAATLEEKHVLASQPDWVQALAFSPDGAYLAAGRYDGVTVLYETEGWTEVRSW